MKVTKIKKTAGGKYKLLIDDETNIITYDEVLLKNNLVYKKDIDNETLNKINIDTKYYNNYLKVIKFISFRIRSKKEINDYCDKNNILVEEKDAIMLALTKENLINDALFAKAFIADKINFSSLGPYRIKKELLAHEIDELVIDQFLDTIDDDTLITKIGKYINKKVKSNTKYSNYILRQKLYQQLLELGFGGSMIDLCLNEALDKENNQALEREYTKIYNRLKNKYPSDELLKQIKNKLYQRGFALAEITSFLKED